MRRLDHHKHRLRGKPKGSDAEERLKLSKRIEHYVATPKARPAKHSRAELREMADKAFKVFTEQREEKEKPDDEPGS